MAGALIFSVIIAVQAIVAVGWGVILLAKRRVLWGATALGVGVVLFAVALGYTIYIQRTFPFAFR